MLPWMWAYHCLPKVRMCEVLGESEMRSASFTCPLTGSTFLPGETVWPCYVRLPMGGIRSAEIMQHMVERILEAKFAEDADVHSLCRPISAKARVHVGTGGAHSC